MSEKNFNLLTGMSSFVVVFTVPEDATKIVSTNLRGGVGFQRYILK